MARASSRSSHWATVGASANVAASPHVPASCPRSESRCCGTTARQPTAVSAGPARLGFFTELAVGCAENALLRGYSLVLVPPSEDPGALGLLDIDGAILLEPPADDPLATELAQRDIPFVTIGEDLDGAGSGRSVDLRHHDVADLLLAHLTERGARTIGLLVGSSGRQSQDVFRSLYLERAEASGASPAIAVADERGGEQAGYEAARSLLRERPDLDALCVPIDAFASGAVAAAGEAGRTVGEDLLVATRYDGIRARSARPPLTAVDLHLGDVSRVAVDLLLAELDRADGGDAVGAVSARAIPAPVLLPRASTAAISSRPSRT